MSAPERNGLCGRSSSARSRAWTTSTAAACTRRTRRWRSAWRRDVYTRRSEGVSIWVVPSNAITAADPADRESFVDPMADKIYRHPTFYELPDEVKHM